MQQHEDNIIAAEDVTVISCSNRLDKELYSMARKVINELKWHPGKSLKGVFITYIHRGAPGDVVTINARDILAVEKSFMVLKGEEGNKRIPYHRIVEIRKDRQVLWKKKWDVSRSEK